VFEHCDGVVLCLVGEGRFAGEVFYFLVQLERVVAGLRTEHSSPTSEVRALDISCTCSTRTFLLLQLLGGTADFITLLRLVRTLALVGQVALHVEINSVIVGLNAEYRIGKRYFSARIFTTGFDN